MNNVNWYYSTGASCSPIFHDFYKDPVSLGVSASFEPTSHNEFLGGVLSTWRPLKNGVCVLVLASCVQKGKREAVLFERPTPLWHTMYESKYCD